MPGGVLSVLGNLLSELTMFRLSTSVLLFFAVTFILMWDKFGYALHNDPMCEGNCLLFPNETSAGCPGFGNCECNGVDKSTEWPKKGKCRTKPSPRH
uniref:Evasin n=1 Tax=Rhipicephalus appendiculatus TaxID=34631 RepID=A0A131YHF2_RHIAP